MAAGSKPQPASQPTIHRSHSQNVYFSISWVPFNLLAFFTIVLTLNFESHVAIHDRTVGDLTDYRYVNCAGPLGHLNTYHTHFQRASSRVFYLLHWHFIDYTVYYSKRNKKKVCWFDGEQSSQKSDWIEKPESQMVWNEFIVLISTFNCNTVMRFSQENWWWDCSNEDRYI